MSAPLPPGIGHNTGIAERRVFILQEIAAACADIKRRREQALSIEEMLNLEGLPKAILLQRHVVEAAIHYCRAFPRADAGVAVSTILTLLSDNRDCVATLSVRRLSDMLDRSRQHILACIARHEEIATLSKDGPVGKVRNYRPLINRAYADPHMALTWFVDAHSEAASHGRPKNVINDAGPLFQKLVNEAGQVFGKPINEDGKPINEDPPIYTTRDTADNNRPPTTKSCVASFSALEESNADLVVAEEDLVVFHELANSFGRRPGEPVLNPTPRDLTDLMLIKTVRSQLSNYSPDVAVRACSAAVEAARARFLSDRQEGRASANGGIAALSGYVSKALRTKAADIAVADDGAIAKARTEALVQEKVARKRLAAVEGGGNVKLTAAGLSNRSSVDAISVNAFGAQGELE